jgi:hypothetical protein
MRFAGAQSRSAQRGEGTCHVVPTPGSRFPRARLVADAITAHVSSWLVAHEPGVVAGEQDSWRADRAKPATSPISSD